MTTEPARPPEQADRMRRRIFVAGCLAIGAATAGFFAATLRFFVPNVLYEPSRRFDIGPPSGFPPGAVTYLPDRQLFVFNATDGFYAISSVCTHLGCNVKRGGPGFACPCHGSQYDENGQVVQGPAPKPLPWFSLSLSPHDRLIVDLDQQVTSAFRLRT